MRYQGDEITSELMDASCARIERGVAQIRKNQRAAAESQPGSVVGKSESGDMLSLEASTS